MISVVLSNASSSVELSFENLHEIWFTKKKVTTTKKKQTEFLGDEGARKGLKENSIFRGNGGSRAKRRRSAD